MPFDMRKSVALVGGSWDTPAAFPACKGKNDLRMSIEMFGGMVRLLRERKRGTPNGTSFTINLTYL